MHKDNVDRMEQHGRDERGMEGFYNSSFRKILEN
jgi:hypothetical protein